MSKDLVNSGKFETYSVKTLHQLLITQTVVCVKPRIKVLRRKCGNVLIQEHFHLNNYNVELALLGDSYLCGVEDIRQQEVEQSPQLMEVVLQWCSSQQQAVGCFEFSHDF